MKAWQMFVVVAAGIVAAGCTSARPPAAAGGDPRARSGGPTAIAEPPFQPSAGDNPDAWSRRPTTPPRPSSQPGGNDSVVFIPPGPPTTISHYVRQITLTPKSPRDNELGVALLRVEPDGTVVITVDRTEGTFSAKPGEYFPIFGRRGLYLSSSDPKSKTAELVRRGAEYH